MPLLEDKVLEELFKGRLAHLRSDSEYATQSVSSLVRLVALGLTGLLIPFVTSKPNELPVLLLKHPGWVEISAIAGALAIAAEIAQHVLADRLSRLELQRIESNLKVKNLIVDSPKDFMMGGRPWQAAYRRTAYYSKMLLVFSGLIVLLITMSATYRT